MLYIRLGVRLFVFSLISFYFSIDNFGFSQEISNSNGGESALIDVEGEWFPGEILWKNQKNIDKRLSDIEKKISRHPNFASNWHDLLRPNGWGAIAIYGNVPAQCRRISGWIEFRGVVGANDSKWSLKSSDGVQEDISVSEVIFQLLPDECRPKTFRVTSTPCLFKGAFGGMCNIEFFENGDVRIYIDRELSQIRLDGVRIWGEKIED